MRDILFKNLTSSDHHRRDVFLSESFFQNGITIKTQKHFMYYIRDYTFLDNPEKLKTWLKIHTNNKGPRLRTLSVLKSYDSRAGEEKIEVKVVGTIYVLREQDIFDVDFTQVFKINRKGEKLKNIKNKSEAQE